MNLVIVTSCLNPLQTPLSYVGTRSLYTVEDRHKHMMRTLGSIEKYIPDAYIVVLENSVDKPPEYVEAQKKVTNEYRDYSQQPELLEAANSIYKGHGETMCLLEFFNTFDGLDKVANIFKISGRYWINEKFDYKMYANEKNQFWYNKQHHVVSTRLFKIGKPNIPEFVRSLTAINRETKNGVSTEASFCNHTRDYEKLDTLGVSGYISVGDLRGNESLLSE